MLKVLQSLTTKTDVDGTLMWLAFIVPLLNGHGPDFLYPPPVTSCLSENTLL